MPLPLPFTPPYRRRRPRRALRHAPSPRLEQRLERAIEALERWMLLLHAPDGRREWLERTSGAEIAAALQLACRAAARETRTDWLPAWADDAQISNHDAMPLVSRAYTSLKQIKARYEVRGAR